MAHPLWPLFDLRLRTDRLELRLPTDDDLVALAAVARAGIHPAGEMPFAAAWSTVPPPAFDRSFAQFNWSNRAGWTPDRWVLPFGVFADDHAMGVQDITAADFAHLRLVKTGSWLGLPFQGRGYGKEMRAAVLGFAFDHLRAELAETEAFLDNLQSAGVSRSLGYEPNGAGRLAPEGIARETQRFRMTLEQWRSRERPRLEVVGLDACRELFGLDAAS